jgi:hypothetical protein
MNDSILSDDDTRFVKLCESIEDCIREVDNGEGKYSDLEIMQALNFVGFNFFRDDWEEFKKIDSSKDSSFDISRKVDGKNLVN